MSIKVRMAPSPSELGGVGGVNTVIAKYEKYLPKYGVELTADDLHFDVFAVHAGYTMTLPNSAPVVSHLHGIYFTGEYQARAGEWMSNRRIVHNIRASHAITVPSPWVAEVLQRDMHRNPHVLPHAIDFDEWQTDGEHDDYVIAYAKNRTGIDVCNPKSASELVRRCKDIRFAATYISGEETPNVRTFGTMPYEDMKALVKRAAVFVSPVKETFGIGPLEAMAAGVPILTPNVGHVPHLAPHGIAGYTYRAGDIEDMERGLRWCLENRDVLSHNAQEIAKGFTWDAVARQLAQIYYDVCDEYGRTKTVSVVIPVYNKRPEQLERAVKSAVEQTREPKEVVVIDDGSDPELSAQYVDVCKTFGDTVVYAHKENGGVATARNAGVGIATADYICCLDADDAIAPSFLQVCADALDEDRSLALAYTRLLAIDKSGNETVSKWPGEWVFDHQLARRNQVPTCNVFRREAWVALGGYRQRYAPTGAGAEDAEFWLRMGARGYGARLVSQKPLFIYSLAQGYVSGNPEYREVDWLAWHPWANDNQSHPLGSYASVKYHSHPVRYYDEAQCSVIIPCAKHHVQYLWDALDSLEAQSFAYWEAVVVLDFPDALGDDEVQRLQAAFPFAKFVQGAGVGAGAARNLGVLESNSPFLLFLDADDYLLPGFLSATMSAWNETGAAIYTDYFGIADVDDPNRLANHLRQNIVERNGTITKIRHNAADYVCEQAVQQPAGEHPFIWNTVTTLVPRAWHDAIGGFDETLESWEDVDYYWRLAKSGKCMQRVNEPLLVYRFTTGRRRQSGLELWASLRSRLSAKHKELAVMPCNCKGTSASSLVSKSPAFSRMQTVFNGTQDRSTDMNDHDMVMVEYTSNNRGRHPLRGQATGIKYNYRRGGERFLVHKDDIAKQPHLFRVLEAPRRAPRPADDVPGQPEAPTPIFGSSETPPKPEPVSKAVPAKRAFPEREVQPMPDDYLRYPPSIAPNVAATLRKAGYTSMEKLREASADELIAVRGVGEASVNALLEWLNEVD